MWVGYLNELLAKNVGAVVCIKMNSFMRWCISRGYDVDTCKSQYYAMLKALERYKVQSLRKLCYMKSDVARVIQAQTTPALI